jgi:hypothetical protein
MQPPQTPIPSQDRERLAELVTRRRQLVEIKPPTPTSSLRGGKADDAIQSGHELPLPAAPNLGGMQRRSTTVE